MDVWPAAFVTVMVATEPGTTCHRSAGPEGGPDGNGTVKLTWLSLQLSRVKVAAFPGAPQPVSWSTNVTSPAAVLGGPEADPVQGDQLPG